MIEWTYIWIGILFSIIMIRLLKGIISEILFFGTLITLIFSWHWEFTTFLGFPHLPIEVYRFGAGVLFAWIGYRVWLMIATQLKNKQFNKLTKFIFGKVEKLKF